MRDDYSLCEVRTPDKPIHGNAARRMIGLWQLSKRKVVIPFQHASVRHGVPCAPSRGGGAPGPAKPNARKISGLPRTPQHPGAAGVRTTPWLGWVPSRMLPLEPTSFNRAYKACEAMRGCRCAVCLYSYMRTVHPQPGGGCAGLSTRYPGLHAMCACSGRANTTQGQALQHLARWLNRHIGARYERANLSDTPPAAHWRSDAS